MPTEKPIVVTHFRYYRSSTSPKCFDGFQLLFSNGRYSPLFTALDGVIGVMEEIALDFEVRKITGTHNKDWVS